MRTFILATSITATTAGIAWTMLMATEAASQIVNVVSALSTLFVAL